MKNVNRILLIAASVMALARSSSSQQSEQPPANPFERLMKVEAPVVLCIDDQPAAGGQPTSSAYAKAAANGFRSVLTLRSASDGVDLIRERFMVEQNKMRYFNISATTKLPRLEQVDEFLRLARDQSNHPMLINCGFAERVAPLLMIFRIVEQGWSEEKAVEEAGRSGLKNNQLREFARAYRQWRKKKSAKTAASKSTPTAQLPKLDSLGR